MIGGSLDLISLLAHGVENGFTIIVRGMDTIFRIRNEAEQGAAANPYPLRSWGCATRHRQLITSSLWSPVRGGRA